MKFFFYLKKEKKKKIEKKKRLNFKVSPKAPKYIELALVVDDGLLRVENGIDVTFMQSILSSIMELDFRCFEELSNEKVNIKGVLVKLKKKI